MVGAAPRFSVYEIRSDALFNVLLQMRAWSCSSSVRWHPHRPKDLACPEPGGTTYKHKQRIQRGRSKCLREIMLLSNGSRRTGVAITLEAATLVCPQETQYGSDG
jgi:hypothetical protein